MTQCSMYYFKNSEAIFNIRIQDSEQMLACLLVCRTCPKQTVKKGPMMCVKLSCLHHYLASVLTIKRASWFFFFMNCVSHSRSALIKKDWSYTSCIYFSVDSY